MLSACAQQPPPFQHQVEVIAANTEAPIANAKIRAEIGTRDVYEANANADGVATFTLDAEHLGAWAKVIITAAGYQRHSILVQLLEDSSPSVVALDPE